MEIKEIVELNINWRNAEVYNPTEIDIPIVYCTNKGKIGTLKNTYGMYNGDENTKHSIFDWYKKKYNIKWWIYQLEILPE